MEDVAHLRERLRGLNDSLRLGHLDGTPVGIVTVTEPFGRTPTIAPVTDLLPLYGRLGVRKGYDRHAELFAAGMGIGVLLPEHSDIADEPTRHRHRRATD